MRKAALAILILTISCGVFFFGVYVGNVQGFIYAQGTSSLDLSHQIRDAEHGEYFSGEFYNVYNERLTSKIEWYGEHLEKIELYLIVPSPLGTGHYGSELMKDAIAYRLVNPYVERVPDWAENEPDSIDEDLRELGLSEDEIAEIERNSNKLKESRMKNYDRALNHVRSLLD